MLFVGIFCLLLKCRPSTNSSGNTLTSWPYISLQEIQNSEEHLPHHVSIHYPVHLEKENVTMAGTAVIVTCSTYNDAFAQENHRWWTWFGWVEAKQTFSLFPNN